MKFGRKPGMISTTFNESHVSMLKNLSIKRAIFWKMITLKKTLGHGLE